MRTPSVQRTKLFALILLPFLLSACGQGEGADQRRAPVVRRVEMGVVTTRPLDRVLEAPAVLEPVSSAEVGVKTQGRVATLLVDEGVHVKRGQVLARLSSPNLSFERAGATASSSAVDAEVRRARIDRDQKRRDYDRAVRLHEEGVFSTEAVERALSNLQMAEAALDNLARRGTAGSATAAAIGAQADELNLVSPIDGQVSRRMIEPGQVVSPGFIAFRVIDLAKLKAVAYVTEEELPAVQEGQAVVVVLSSLAETVAGSVTAVVRELDPVTRLAKVEVVFENPDRRYASGMRGIIRITTASRPSAVVVPASAIISKEDGDFVFVLADGKARQTPVTIAYRRDPWVAIDEGVKAGDAIVTGNLGGLRTGTPIAPFETAEESTDPEKPSPVPRTPRGDRP